MLVLVMATIAFTSEGAFVYSIAYDTMMPDYICQSAQKPEPFHCSKVETCSGDYDFYVNWENRTSLDNWVQDYGLRCTSSMNIGLLGTSFFIGNIVGSMSLARFGDTHGRMFMMKIGLSLHMFIYFTLVFISRTLIVTTGLLFIMGILG